MDPLSSLSLPSDNLDDLLVKGIYDGTVELEDEKGNLHFYFVKEFGGYNVLFNGDGIAYLHQAAIAALLGISRQAVNQSIATLTEAGYISERYVNVLLTNLNDEGVEKRQRLLAVYSSYVINLIAARLKKPTDQALAFLSFREDIFEAHQKMIHHNRLKLLAQLGETLEKLESVTWAALEGEKQLRGLQAYVDDLTKERDEALNQSVLNELEAQYGNSEEWE